MIKTTIYTVAILVATIAAYAAIVHTGVYAP